MPNWALTDYVVTGGEVKNLYLTMKELEEMSSPGLHENDFGSTWLGNLVIKLGGDWEKIRCRGYWSNLMYEDDKLYFTVESAWEELSETRKFVEEKFPDLKIYYQCEEPGLEIYTTNDKDGLFFPDKYRLWVEDNETNYYRSLEKLIQDVKKITDKDDIKTIWDCEKALSEWSGDRCYELSRFEYVD